MTAPAHFTNGVAELDRYFQLFHWLHDVIGCCGICSADIAIIQVEKERGTNQPPVRSKCQRPMVEVPGKLPTSACDGLARAAWKTMPVLP